MVQAIYLPYYSGTDSLLVQKKARLSQGDARQVYAQTAHQLYRWLMEPVAESGAQLMPRLTIVPDDILNVLPFDALLAEAVPAEEYGYYGNTSYRFLLKDYTFHYCSSASLLREMAAEVSFTDQRVSRLLVFNGHGFESEVKAIRDEFTFLGGIKWFVHPLWSKSNKQKLESIGAGYRYHHYSAHGILNNDNPSLSHFVLQGDSVNQDNILYLHELYRLPMQQDMTVTSVCNAGIGQIQRGQGMLSMARGFSYSGTPQPYYYPLGGLSWQHHRGDQVILPQSSQGHAQR